MLWDFNLINSFFKYDRLKWDQIASKHTTELCLWLSGYFVSRGVEGHDK